MRLCAEPFSLKTMKTPISNLLTIAALCGLAWILLAPGFAWTGGVAKTLTIRVTEGEARRPVEGAAVIVIRWQRDKEHIVQLSAAKRRSLMADLSSDTLGITSPEGTVRLRGQFPAAGVCFRRHNARQRRRMRRVVVPIRA